MHAVIVGGGIAGPATALALNRVGIASTVYESHGPADREVGSWLTVAPNGLDALDVLGVLPAIRSIGHPTRTNVMRGADGTELGRLPIGRPLSDGTPALTMKRSHLGYELAQECRRRGIDIRYEAALISANSADGDGVTATFSDGSEASGDLLIGADGVKSRTRALIDSSAPAARYVGLVNFGGITGGTDLVRSVDASEPAAWQFYFGRRAFFGCHPLPSGEVMWFVNEPREQVSVAEREATDESGWLTHLSRLFAEDAGPATSLIAGGRLELAGDNTHDLSHVPCWHRDSMIVIGDAAHAPAPSSGQGASIALEDAVVLAQCLRNASDVPSAFTAYEARRRVRVEKIVAAGARSSSAKTPGALTRPIRDATLKLVFRYAVTEKNTAWMYDHRLER